MKIEQIKEIANAVLYEGYLLYPYRRSSIKNQQRWNFGLVYPREYSEANGGTEPWTMHTECLVATQPRTELGIYVRFLHLLQVQSEDKNKVSETWEEGVEREIKVVALALDDLIERPRRIPISFAGGTLDSLPSSRSAQREQQPIVGTIIIAAEPASAEAKNIYRVSVQIENTTTNTATWPDRSHAVLLQSFVSTHTILQLHQGSFISLLEPPEELQTAAQQCQNVRTWPVLVGEVGETDAMLSSPIIMYDYPQIAPESAGSLFDGTEIDEILTLRIMTLTDEEKAEMREGDERAAEILERTEALSPEQMMKLHGAIRGLRPVGATESEGSYE